MLQEVAALLRDFHQAMADFEAGELSSTELADPAGGGTFCHNDVCPENIVFRDGRAVGLLDFDVAAPGRVLWDVARTARMWVPVAAPGTGTRWPAAIDVLHRLSVFTSAYGLTTDDGADFAGVLGTATLQGHDWVRGKVAAGEPAFVQMWQEHGLAEVYARDADWLAASGEDIAAAVGRR